MTEVYSPLQLGEVLAPLRSPTSVRQFRDQCAAGKLDYCA